MSKINVCFTCDSVKETNFCCSCNDITPTYDLPDINVMRDFYRECRGGKRSWIKNMF